MSGERSVRQPSKCYKLRRYLSRYTCCVNSLFVGAEFNLDYYSKMFATKQALKYKFCEVVNKTWRLVRDFSHTSMGYKWGVKPIRRNRDSEARPWDVSLRYQCFPITNLFTKSSNHFQLIIRFVLFLSHCTLLSFGHVHLFIECYCKKRHVC